MVGEQLCHQSFVAFLRENFSFKKIMNEIYAPPLHSPLNRITNGLLTHILFVCIAFLAILTLSITDISCLIDDQIVSTALAVLFTLVYSVIYYVVVCSSSIIRDSFDCSKLLNRVEPITQTKPD